MNIKISIIVPVYNSEKYISKCIESIINSSLKELEILVIDDGSKDNSLSILKMYEEKDSRVKVYTQKNSGPAAARNKGIKLAKGKYIGFVDSDDTIENNMYEILFNLAEKQNIEMAMCNYLEKNSENQIINKVENKLEPEKIYYKNDIENKIISTFTSYENYGFFSLWNKIYLRKWIIDNNIFMDEKRFHGEDWLFNINVFTKISSFICTDKYLYNYIHINNESLMVKYIENKFDLFLDGRMQVKALIPDNLIDYDKFNNNFFREFSAYIINTYKNINDSKKRKTLIYNVINNEEVKECCKEANDLPIYYKITSFFMKHNMNLVTLFIYKILSKIV